MLTSLQHESRRLRIARHLAAALALGILCIAITANAAPPASPIPTSTVQGTRAGQVRQATHTPPVVTPGQRGDQIPAAGTAPAAGQTEPKMRLRGGDADADRQRSKSSGGGRGILTALTSLALVLGLFTGVVWLLRRSSPQVAGRLPREVVEVLGHATLGHRQQAQLVRLGKKLILINVTPTGAETLSEVTEAAEVERLAALCRPAASPAAPVSFRGVLEQFRQQNKSGTSPRSSSLGSGLLAEPPEGSRV